MKFTKRRVITTCAIVSIIFSGVKLSLKTMEKTSSTTATASQEPMPRLGWYAQTRIETLHKRAARELVQKLQSTTALDEFRDMGTVDGKPLGQLVSNNWALEFFKPALANLVYPWDGNFQILKGHIGLVKPAAFSPDGTRIVTASWGNTAYVWTQQGNTWTSVELIGHTNGVFSAAFSPDGTKIITTSSDRSARVWTQQGNTWTSVELIGYTDGILSTAFSPYGTRIVTTSWSNTARVWTQQGNTWTSVELIGHTDGVRYAVFSPDGTRIITATYGKTARVWMQQSNTWTSVELTGHKGWILSAAFSPDGTRIVTVSLDGTSRVWTQIDLVGTDITGNDNIASYIMLLQLLARDGKEVLNNKHLRTIYETFDKEPKKYLSKKYGLRRRDAPVGDETTRKKLRNK